MSTELLTQKEACQILHLSPKSLQRLRRHGKLPFVQFGHRTIRIRKSDLEAYIEHETVSHQRCQ